LLHVPSGELILEPLSLLEGAAAEKEEEEA
jgi:hypothetical protein